MEMVADIVGVGLLGLTVAAPVFSLLVQLTPGDKEQRNGPDTRVDKAQRNGPDTRVDKAQRNGPDTRRASAPSSPASPIVSSTPSLTPSLTPPLTPTAPESPRRRTQHVGGLRPSPPRPPVTRHGELPLGRPAPPSLVVQSSHRDAVTAAAAGASGSQATAASSASSGRYNRISPAAYIVTPPPVSNSSTARAGGIRQPALQPGHSATAQNGTAPARAPAPAPAPGPGSAPAGPRSAWPHHARAPEAPWNASMRRAFDAGTAVHSYDATEAQGPHPHWEDRHVVFVHQGRVFFGVFDGHGRGGYGDRASAFCSQHMRTSLTHGSNTTAAATLVDAVDAAAAAGTGAAVAPKTAASGTGAAAATAPGPSPGALTGPGTHGGKVASSIAGTRAAPQGVADGAFTGAPVGVDALGPTPMARRRLLVQAFREADEAFLAAYPGPARHAGTTALLVSINASSLCVANAGDCRAVLSRGGRAVPLTTDHKPSLRSEFARIVAAGGRIVQPDPRGPLRVCSPDGRTGLAVSRGLGDHAFKDPHYCRPDAPLLSPLPDVFEVPLHRDQDDLVIMASDGLWDVMSSQQAVDIARATPTNVSPSDILVRKAVDCGSQDNVTVIVIRL